LAGPGVPGGVERDEQVCARWAGPGVPDELSKCVPGGLGQMCQVELSVMSKCVLGGPGWLGQVCQVELSVMSRLLNCAR